MITFNDKADVGFLGRPPSLEFCERAIKFYHDQPSTILSEIWSGVTSRFHSLLLLAIAGGSKSLHFLLSSLYNGELVGGVDYPSADPITFIETWDSQLKQVAVLLGVIPMYNPTQPVSYTCSRLDLLKAVEVVVCKKLTHPGGGNIQGMLLEDRFIPVKLLNAVCVTTAIGRNVGIIPLNMLEIGSGTGFIPFLWRRLEPNSTCHIVDIPTTSIMAAYMLSVAYGEQNVHFYPQEVIRDTGFIFHGAFPKSISVDVVINQDSLPEMVRSEQHRYLSIVEDVLVDGGSFYSINQESVLGNQQRVFEIIQSHHRLRLRQRNSFIPRQGYVEEVWVKV